MTIKEFKIHPMLACDGYKLSHRDQYPTGTEYVYSTWTPRTSRIENVDKVVIFGIQYAIQKIHELFYINFFNCDFNSVSNTYLEIMKSYGISEPQISHLKELHDLGYLPIKILALKEGTLSSIRVPILTIENTDSKFFWVTNFLETFLSCELWMGITNATIAFEYKKILLKYANLTSCNKDFIDWQAHDFSMRGHTSFNSAMISGMAHLTSFNGTDTIPSIQAINHYYDYTGFIAGTVPATEHSVQCSYNDDYNYFDKMLNLYPNGIVSIVADGYDYFNVLLKILPKLKNKILLRNGKLVIRPDSGNPVKIICGDPLGKTEEERKGSVQLLWELFGGVVNSKGYKELDSHIGLIYGDSITIDTCEEICSKLKDNGFSSSNVVFGIGSFTYQYNTRDTFGFAMKATSVTINGVEKPIFKDPKTGDGVKKSQKGRVVVINDKLQDGFYKNNYLENDLKIIYENGKFLKRFTFLEIKETLEKELAKINV